MLDRCVGYKGADGRVRESYWGKYTGTFDAETMQRVIIEMVEEAGVEVLLRATVIETVMQDGAMHGLVIRTKSGESLVLAKAFIDASGDGDVAALAGAEFMLGRERRRADAADHLLFPPAQRRRAGADRRLRGATAATCGRSSIRRRPATGTRTMSWRCCSPASSSASRTRSPKGSTGSSRRTTSP